ncbi:MAG: hypothetical protein ACI90V_006636 [Bacillariaceae sp.]|jgi:hypothetical protein
MDKKLNQSRVGLTHILNMPITNQQDQKRKKNRHSLCTLSHNICQVLSKQQVSVYIIPILHYVEEGKRNENKKIIMTFSRFYLYYFVVITLSGVVVNMCCISSSGGIRLLCVAAFRSIEIGGGNSRRNYRYAATNNGDTNDWISRLEEQFKKSENNNNNKDEEEEEHNTVPRRQRSFQTPVTTYAGVLDLLNNIDNAQSNDLTVVLFFSFYCRTCHRANIPFKQLAYSSSPDINFIRFETSVLTPKQFRSLGIDRVPYIQIYRNKICVASFTVTTSSGNSSSTSRNAQMMLRPRLLENISACRRSVADWYIFRDMHDKEIERNKAARNKLRADVINDSSHSDYSVDEDEDDDNERQYRSVRTLTSEADLLQVIRGNKNDEGNDNTNNDDGIVVVMYHNHFERSCLRAQHKYRRIANEQLKQQQRSSSSSSSSSWCMARIETSVLSDNTLQLLGVRLYPHIQVYLGRTCVASFSIPQPYLFAKKLRESLEIISTRTTQEWDEFYDQNNEEIKSQQNALDVITRDHQLSNTSWLDITE